MVKTHMKPKVSHQRHENFALKFNFYLSILSSADLKTFHDIESRFVTIYQFPCNKGSYSKCALNGEEWFFSMPFKDTDDH